MGHCALRQFVMGDAATERAATSAEVEKMKAVLVEGVRAGAIGFSTNQNPVHMFADGRPIPSRLATNDEIIELACALGEINKGVVQISVVLWESLCRQSRRSSCSRKYQASQAAR